MQLTPNTAAAAFSNRFRVTWQFKALTVSDATLTGMRQQERVFDLFQITFSVSALCWLESPWQVGRGWKGTHSCAAGVTPVSYITSIQNRHENDPKMFQ